MPRVALPSVEIENAVGREGLGEVLNMLSLKPLLYFHVEVLSKLLPCMNLDFRSKVWAGDINF